MQRHTNLFYTTGQDSKFLTFSNYTENLTGSFLSTNWKMYPSRFICLEIPFLDHTQNNYEQRKKQFIISLAALYENKLAFMRDYYLFRNIKVDEKIMSCAWLLETILKEYPSSKITFIGKVSEHNYNGAYADTICNIDSTEKTKIYTVNIVEDEDLSDYVEYVDKKNVRLQNKFLYGWSDNGQYTGLADYASVTPKFDKTIITTENDSELEHYYYRTTTIIESITETTDPENSTIKFNVIIPLFDLVNVDTEENVNNINENIETLLNTNNSINIPLGIWFADKLIELERDTNTNYAPSWSLVLSTQFKPFPYSNVLVDEPMATYADSAFATFAQVMVKQNNIIDSFSDLSTKTVDLSNRIDRIETLVNNLGTISSIDGLHKEMIQYKQYLNQLIDEHDVNIDNAIDTNNALVNKLQQNIMTNNTDILELQSYTSIMQRKLDNVEEKLAYLFTYIYEDENSIIKRIERLEQENTPVNLEHVDETEPNE